MKYKKEIRAFLKLEWGREPTDKEIAAWLEFSVPENLPHWV